MSDGPETVGDDSPEPASGLETRLVDGEPLVAVDAVSEPRAFEIGAKLGRYVLLRELGRGGMAVVYVAYDPELDRKIALKLVRPRRRTRTTADQERLLREAQALARLSHPNVVHVYDVGIYEAHVYIAMELVEGHTLRKWLTEAPRSWRDVLDVCARAGRGLAAAHAAGLVHLDFKPGNVLLGDDGRVRVVDFGLAREPRSRSQESGILPRVLEEPGQPPTIESVTGAHRLLGEQLTEYGAVMGTPGYIAPEQLRGEQPDARADQFSFCVALWEALFGQRPFLAKGRERLDSIVLAGRITEPPSDRRVPPRLRRIVERGLSVRPDARFADMNALIAALERVPARARVRTTARVGVLALGAAGIGYHQAASERGARCAGGEEKIDLVWSTPQREAGRAAFEATGLVFARDVWRGAELALDHHADAWKAAYVDACEATHVRGEQSAEMLDLRMHCLERARGDLSALIGVFARADEAIVRNAVEATAKLGSVARCTDVVTLRAEGRPADPAVREAVDALDAELAHAKGLDYAGHAKRALEEALSISERATALDYPPLEARVAFATAAAYSSLGDEKNAELMLRRTLVLAEQAGLEIQRVHALTQLGYVVGYRGADYERGKWFLSLARAILDRHGEAGVPLAEVYSNGAVLEAASGRPDEALVLLHEALRIRRDVEGFERVDVAVVLSNMGGAHFSKGEYEEALAHYREVHDLRVEVYGEAHPVICDSFENLGNVLHAMGRSEEALEHHRRGRTLCEEIGVGGLATAQRLNNEATVLLGLSRPQEAIERYRQALTFCEGQARHPTRGIILSNLGEALLVVGEVDQALTLYEESLEIIEEALGREQVYWAVARAGMGHALLELGRTAESLDALQQSVAVLGQTTADPQMLAEAEFHLGRALVEASSDPDDRARAIALVRRSRDTFATTGDRGKKLVAASQAWLDAQSAR